MFNLKNRYEKGITLIALIVTVVVLLILAGITIVALNGDNGILGQAIDSQVETELSQLQEKLNRYKLKNEGERIGRGDYSGEMSNDDLINNGIVKKVVVKEENMTIGIIYLDKLGESSNLGNNAVNINVDEVEKLTDLNDVFAIDFGTNDIYYIKGGKYWIRDGEGQYIYNSETGIDYEGPQIIVTPSKSEELKPLDVEIEIKKGTNELSSDNEYEYYLSASNDDFVKGKWIKYTSGDKKNIGDGLTGDYYLYIKEIYDEKGLKSIGGKEVIVDGEKYHRFGKYAFDSEEREYKIEYELNGGTVEGNPNVYTNLTQDFTLKNPTKEGYTFIGWTGSNGDTPQKEVTIEKWSRGDRKYIANWQINSYTVTYDYKTNGGTSSTKTTATVNYQAKIDLTPTATKSGYTFVGWNTNKDATVGITDLTMGTENVTLYAIYKKVIVATFKYYNNQTSTISNTVFNNTTSVTIKSPTIANTTISGTTYTARGWSTSNVGNATINLNANTNVTLSESRTYYASYSYTITATYYYYNGSSYTSSRPTATGYMNYTGTKIGAKPTTPTVKNPSGWTARGWSTSNSATGTVTTPGTITSNATYYYSWSKTVKLTYNANSGSGAPSAQNGTAYLNYAGTTTSASLKISSTKPTRANYTFQNWNTASGGTGTAYSSGGTIKISGNTTIYAIWKGNPTLSITKQPSALTVVAGNKGSFSVTVSGNGTIKYQWYYNTTGGNSSGTAVSGATGSTYSFTSSSGMNNRYYYCTVTCTVGGVTKTVKSSAVKLTVQAANYSTLKSGTTTYYNTLNSAINGATSGGGDSGGGTIKVLNSLTDNSTASTNKTIAINTNGKTVTRNASIITTGGTLTIKGNGSIYCNNINVATIQCNGGNLSTAGQVLLKGYANVIETSASAGNININTSYIYSLKGTCIELAGSGTLTTYNSWVYVPCRNKPCIYVASGSTKNLNLTGSTRMGNGSSNDIGTGNTDAFSTIKDWGTGTINIADSTCIMAGPYAHHTIWIEGRKTINCTGSGTVYNTNQTTLGSCFYLNTSGVTINFNGTGNFRTPGNYVVYSGNNSANLILTKSQFASGGDRYMFYVGGQVLTNAASTDTAGPINLNYLTAYNAYTTIQFTGYYSRIGY